MTGLPSVHAIDAAEYAAIESTIGASERGQLFLAEHARRARSDDLRTVLSAVERLEHTITAGRANESVGDLRGDLMEMADAISRTKAEITAINAPGSDRTHLTSATQALDAIVRATEQATSDILGAAESVQEAAWTLRERNVEPETCEALDRHATAIYTACSFQDLTAQRTARIIYTLRYLEDRIAAMIGIWGGGIERVPALAETAEAGKPPMDELCQLDVDRYIAMSVPAVTAAAIVAEPGSLALHEDIVFVPVSDPSEAEAEAAARTIEAAAVAARSLAEAVRSEALASLLATDGEGPHRPSERPVAEDSAAFDLPEPEDMTLEGLDGMTADERLAVFA